jgi:hypothetical protein
MTKKQRLEKEEAWKTDPKNPRVVYESIVSEPLYHSEPLDKPIIVCLLILGVLVLFTGALSWYTECLTSLLGFGLLGLMNALGNHNKSWKIFLGVTLISLLGLGFFVLLKLNGIVW